MLLRSDLWSRILRRHAQLSDDIAQKLILSRSSDTDDGKDALGRNGITVVVRDFLTYFSLVSANRSESRRWYLSDDELSPQLD